MNSYQIPSPRKAFAAASIAMTAITLALAVVIPAKIGVVTQDVRTLAPIEVVARPKPIDVGGDHEAEVVSVQVRMPAPKRKQES